MRNTDIPLQITPILYLSHYITKTDKSYHKNHFVTIYINISFNFVVFLEKQGHFAQFPPYNIYIFAKRKPTAYAVGFLT